MLARDILDQTNHTGVHGLGQQCNGTSCFAGQLSYGKGKISSGSQNV